MTILRGLLRLLFKLNFTQDDHTDMDAKNIMEMLIVLTMRCNYHSTIQGIVVSQIGTRIIMDTWPEPWNLITADILFLYEVAITMIDDGVCLFIAGWRFVLHRDPYNISLIVGKIVKIFVQYSYYTFMGDMVVFIPYESKPAPKIVVVMDD